MSSRLTWVGELAHRAGSQAAAPSPSMAMPKAMHTVDEQSHDAPSRTAALTGSALPTWGKLIIGAGVLGSEGVTGYLHPVFGEALMTSVIVVALVLLAAILRGSNETCERVFRLLRWIANRPEPESPCPGHTKP